MTERLVVRAAHPDPHAIDRAAAVIRSGGVVAFPTDTLYGLAADPFNPEAIRRLFDVKGRAEAQPVALVAADLAQVEQDLGAMQAGPRALATRFWPGPLTLLLVAPARLVAGIVSDDGRVGVRVPAHDVARGLCRACGHVVTATSANRSGHQPYADPDELWPELGDRVDLMLDAGLTPGGAPSTIVDATVTPPRLVRGGAIDWDMITEWLRI